MDTDLTDLARIVRASTHPAQAAGQLARKVLEMAAQPAPGPTDAPDFTAVARAIVIAAGRVADTGGTRYAPGIIGKLLADDLAAAWPTPDGPAHLPDWYAGYEAACVDMARAEAAREKQADDLYTCPDWTDDERHRHTIGGHTWEHAHEGGHEAHSAVSHDLSGAKLLREGA